jgi:ABC-type transport system involved in multi-copper enzyme maturation permease subunit
LSNPLILKELIQAAHQRRTYALRVALPVAAGLICGTILYEVIEDMGGQDWRTMSQMFRPVFYTVAWMQLLALTVFGSLYATGSIEREWVHKTVDLLCATPLSKCKIIYGKYLTVLMKMIVLGLALLPVLGVGLNIARIEASRAFGAILITFGSLLLYAALAIAEASLMTRKHGKRQGLSGLTLLFLLAVIVLDVFVFAGHPLLEAAIAPRALFLVLHGVPPAGLGYGAFAGLSFGVHAVLAGALMAVAPFLFGWTFERHIGGGRKAKRLRHKPGALPPLRARANPFLWRERGRRMRRQRWGVLVLLAIVAAFAIGIAAKFGELDEILEDGALFMILFAAGIGVQGLLALAYGATTFANEKTRRTAVGLLLTGHRPRTHLFSRIVAAYRVMWPGLATVVICGLLFASVTRDLRREEPLSFFLFFLFNGALLGPAYAVVIGMGFSVVARDPRAALGGVVSMVYWSFIISFAMGPVALVVDSRLAYGLIGMAGTAGMILFVRNWGPRLLGLLLALSSMGVSIVSGEIMTEALPEIFPDVDLVHALVFASLVCIACAAAWFVMTCRLFDRGMAGEKARLWGRR